MNWFHKWQMKRELRKQIHYYNKVAEFAWYAGNVKSCDEATRCAANLRKKLDELKWLTLRQRH